MVKLTKLSCPACGATLNIAGPISVIKCKFCGAESVFEPLGETKPHASADKKVSTAVRHKPGTEDLIILDDLEVYYRSGGGLLSASKTVKAVDGVTLGIKQGETLGLVGESGCGKSTLLKAILRLTEPTGGKVFYNGKDLAHLPKSAMREQRKHLQMIFQDPYASLNPRMTVGNIIGEPPRAFGLAPGGAGGF